MTRPDPDNAISRRHALALGGGIGAGMLMSNAAAGIAAPIARSARNGRLLTQKGKLPAKKIQDAVGAEGKVSGGILAIEIERTDIGTVTGPQGVPFEPPFEINGELFFQPLGNDLAFLNGDIALKPGELNPVIDAILGNGLAFQAMHQHFFDLDPMVWFIHFRGLGAPLKLARAVHNVLRATSTPLPQKMPSNPKTPLSPKRLEAILKGTADVGDSGVVTVTVSRKDRIVIDGVKVNPDVNISTGVAFQPLNAAGTRAAVAPDFSMTSREIKPVMRTMRGLGFEVGCLYNQETSESPQLFFAHMFAAGDPYDLAHRIRRGLDHTNSD